MLDYKLIEALATVVQEGGFERAAGALCLTQSAVSQRVKLLEEQMGRILLVRSSPPRPTRDGQKVIKHYLQVKRLEDDLVSDTDQGSVPVSLTVGVNADSLATWFLEAVGSLLLSGNILLDMRVDDQDKTHELLKGGEVIGCVSTRNDAIQGCRHQYLGCMRYRMLAAPVFFEQWFVDGVTTESIRCAPALIYNRKDQLHHRLLAGIPSIRIDTFPAHFIPSSEQFITLIRSGAAYGMVPDLQSRTLLENGELVDILPGCSIPVRLYWHYWNLESRVLAMFSRALLEGAADLLDNC